MIDFPFTYISEYNEIVSPSEVDVIGCCSGIAVFTQTWLAYLVDFSENGITYVFTTVRYNEFPPTPRFSPGDLVVCNANGNVQPADVSRTSIVVASYCSGYTKVVGDFTVLINSPNLMCTFFGVIPSSEIDDNGMTEWDSFESGNVVIWNRSGTSYILLPDQSLVGETIPPRPWIRLGCVPMVVESQSIGSVSRFYLFEQPLT